ncbi:hypothetical protein M405DRAFT_823180, partial [Rhizopogon salebrosus TDB-379]
SVAPARDEDRYAIAPPTEAEKAAAMQYAIGNEVNSSAHQGGAAAGVQDPQEGPSTQTSQGQNLAALAEESSDLIRLERFLKLGFDVKVHIQPLAMKNLRHEWYTRANITQPGKSLSLNLTK